MGKSVLETVIQGGADEAAQRSCETDKCYRHLLEIKIKLVEVREAVERIERAINQIDDDPVVSLMTQSATALLRQRLPEFKRLLGEAN